MIYGEFIEFLNDLLPGMWAEKIQDRSFEGVLQPNHLWPPDDNWVYPRWRSIVVGNPCFDRWPGSHEDSKMVNASASFELDQETKFVGSQSAKVNVVKGDDGKPFMAGISQDNIAIKQGEKLNVEIYMRGDHLDGTVKVLIGKNYGVFFRAYDEIELTGVTGDWQKFTGELTSQITDDSATLAIVISTEGTFWLDKVSLMPVDNQFGWRTDIVEAFSDLNPGIIRFGGSSLIYYQWETGIGPRERRVPFENRPWGNMEEHDVGLHEFLQFCELVNAEPLVCLNSNSTTLEQIMDEIEYCNGPANSKFGSIRAEMGHPESFNVKYWQIGNEQSGEEYEKVMMDYAQAMRSKYPELILMASYPSDNILANMSDAVDYICPHFYTPYTKEREDEMRALIEKVKQKAQNKNLKLGITEWNHTAGHMGWGRSWLLTMYNALNAARTLNMYQRLGDMIKIANRSNIVNSCCAGVVQTNGMDTYFTPCYYIQTAYSNLSGDKALKVQLEDNEILDISATQHQKDGSVTLSVVNYLSKPEKRIIDLSAFELSGKTVDVWTLTGSDLDAVNSFQEKDRVSPTSSQVEFDIGGFGYEFPAYSVTILSVR